MRLRGAADGLGIEVSDIGNGFVLQIGGCDLSISGRRFGAAARGRTGHDGFEEMLPVKEDVTRDAAFAAILRLEDLGVVGEVADGQCAFHVQTNLLKGVLDLGTPLHEFLVNDASFLLNDAFFTPAVGDEVVEDIEFDEAGGLEVIDVFLTAQVVILAGFAGEADVDGGEAVLEAIEAGALFAGFGFGTGALLGIGAVGG